MPPAHAPVVRPDPLLRPRLGDDRVNRRVIDLADTLPAAAANSWPDTFASPADYRAFQRLVNRPQPPTRRSAPPTPESPASG